MLIAPLQKNGNIVFTQITTLELELDAPVVQTSIEHLRSDVQENRIR